jgi:hypothetical protein
LGVVGLIAIGGLMGMPALAADMAVKAPPPAPVLIAAKAATDFAADEKTGPRTRSEHSHRLSLTTVVN